MGTKKVLLPNYYDLFSLMSVLLHPTITYTQGNKLPQNSNSKEYSTLSNSIKGALRSFLNENIKL